MQRNLMCSWLRKICTFQHCSDKSKNNTNSCCHSEWVISSLLSQLFFSENRRVQFKKLHLKKNLDQYTVEWPMLWRITKNSLHNEGTYKWVNWTPIFFWYKLLPTTSGPQKFAKIRVVEVDYFDFPGEIFEKLVWNRC